MRLYVQLPPGDGRPLPDDPRILPRPAVLGLDEAASDDALGAYVARCEATRRTPWVEVGTVRDARRAAAAGAALWLRGLEAGGRHGPQSALVLLRAAAQLGRPFVVQGLGRRGMAAALTLGAAGVQVDVHLWGLDDTPLCEAHLTRLRRATARDRVSAEGVATLGPGTVSADWPRDPDSALPCPASVADAEPGPPLARFLPAFADELAARVTRARRDHPLATDPFGCGTPIVQGPMANVAERSELAQAVRAAGALPFCALGALRPDAAQDVLQGMRQVPEPWGVGVIGFDVMPHRDAHLDAVAAAGPRPVILAGGSPALAVSLQQRGLQPWLHTPSGRLARMAVERGVQAVVLEGNEAGGHVGRVPSAALWEEALAALEPCPPALIVLAGGIGDAPSAAFAAAMAADAHRAGHRIGLQAGTAFFFTHEIVEAGQITPTYQQRALAADRTALVGATVDLPLRCAPNAYTDDAVEREQAWRDEGLPLRERRERVERLNLGRTRIAARAIRRAEAGGYRDVSVPEQLRDGAFTMGDGAAASSRLQTVAELVRALTADAAALLEGRPDARSRWGATHTVARPARRDRVQRRARPRHRGGAIAIVGLGCVLPGASDVDAFWRLVRYGDSALRTVPDDRWPAHRYFHPDPGHSPTTSYVRDAGVATLPPPDPVRFGIPPAVWPTMDRAQQLALHAAAQALDGVRIRDRGRCAVLLGNSMGGEHAKSVALRVRAREVLAALGRDGDDALERALDERLATSLPPINADSMAGLLANVIAGRVASWLDLGGANLTVDAACGSALAAIGVAVDQLRAGRCDLAITGGVDADLAPETFVGFCRTHALSPRGSRPFSATADGFVMGEGAAVFALQRAEDAVTDGHPIWALIRGVGAASDGRSTGITAPRAAGQRLAIGRALEDAGVDPAEVGLIEAHGTGTALGDRTEIQALAAVYPRAVLGSVKAQIGHLKGAAGAAGLLRATLALAHRTAPPTLNAGPVRPDLPTERYTLLRSAAPLQTRFAAVSAFGFGGADFHAVLEAADPAPNGGDPPPDPTPWRWSDAAPPLLEAFGADDAAALAQAVSDGATRSPEEVAACAFRAVRIGDAPGLDAWIAGGGRGAFGARAWCEVGPPAPIVAVFPGQGGPRDGAAAVLRRVGAAARVLAQLSALDPDPSNDPAAQHHLLVATGAAYAALLSTTPTLGVIGHSVGELSALVCAGRLDPVDALALADARGAGLARCPEGAMLAVSDPRPPPAGLSLAATNSPGSQVWAGSPERVAATLDALTAEGVRATRLDVRRAFHTDAVQPAADDLAAALRAVRVRPGLRWWSNVPGVPEHPVPDALAEALVRAVTAPVGFQASVQAAVDAGARVFLQAGPGAALTRHIQRIAPDARVVALHPTREADGADLVRAAAWLLALGHPGLLRQLPGSFVEVAFARAVPRRPTPATDLTLSLPSASGAHRPPATLADAAPEAALASPRPTEAPPSSVREAVLRSVTEVTGYPRAALLSGARLDTELGVDSIRKLEIVGRVQELLAVRLDEGALADAEDLDLDALVALIERQLDGRPAVVDAPSDEAPASGLWQLGWALAQPGGEPPQAVYHADGEDLATLIQPFLSTPPTEDFALVARPEVPAHHGLAAFLRVLAHERGLRARAVFQSDAQLDAAWLCGEGPVLVRGGLGWRPAPTPFRRRHPLPEAPVVLASGGADGILAACLRALPGARGVVLGRRERDDLSEHLRYRRSDVTDPAAVRDAAAWCRARFGPIQVVLHAAGLLRDGPAAHATGDDLRAVVNVKLAGAQALIQATLDDAPALWVPFSSVSATLTNPGQSLYAAANAALEQIVHPTAARSVPLAFTAWSDIGMARDPGLQRLLRARGIHPLSPDAGSAAFLDALRGDGRVWLAHAPPPGDPPWPLHLARGSGWSLPLSPEDPLLADHAVAGAPLVPAALWIAACAAAAASDAPGPIRLERVEVRAPAFVRGPADAQIEASGPQITVDVATRRVFTAQLAPTDAPPEALPDAPTPDAAAPHYRPDRLFHGPSWAVLDQVGLRAEGASATLQLRGPGALAQAIDAAHQLLGLWFGDQHGWLALPTGADAWTVWGPAPRGAARLQLVAHATADGPVADAQLRDAATGRLFAHAEGLRARPASRWNAP